MKANPLLVAVALLVVLGGAVYYTMENPPEGDEEDKPVLSAAKLDEIEKIEIRRPSGETVVVERDDEDAWGFGGGVTYRADDAEIDLLATNLAGLEADRVVEEQVDDWRPFGLESPGNLMVTMTPKEGSPVTLVFGNETPTGAGVFVRIEGEPKLYTAFNYVKTGFEKTVYDLRDKMLIPVDQSEIATVAVTVGANSYTIEKTGPNAWKVTEPAEMRADDFTAGEVARSVQGAAMTEVLAEGDAASEYSFARPYATVELTDTAGEAHTITVGRNEAGAYYAKSSDQTGVYGVTAPFAESLDKDLFELRDKNLFDFGFQPPKKLEIRDGDLTHVIERGEGGAWVLSTADGRELDSEKVQALIDSLRNLTAVGFPSGGAGAAVIEATVTLETDETETVMISGGDAPRGLRQGEETVYQLEAGPVEELRLALEAAMAAGGV